MADSGVLDATPKPFLVTISSDADDRSPAMDLCDDGSLVIGSKGSRDWTLQPGSWQVDISSNDAYLARISSGGQVMWAESFRSWGSTVDLVCSGATIYVSTARSGGEVGTFDLNGNPGDPVQTCNQATVVQLEPAPGGDLYLAGEALPCTLSGGSGPDLPLDLVDGIFLARRAPDGSWRWARTIQGRNSSGYGLASIWLEAGADAGVLLGFSGDGDRMTIARGRIDQIEFEAEPSTPGVTDFYGYVAAFTTDGALNTAVQLVKSEIGTAALGPGGEIWVYAHPWLDTVLEPAGVELNAGEEVLLRVSGAGTSVVDLVVDAFIYDMALVDAASGEMAIVGMVHESARSEIIDVTGAESFDGYLAILSSSAQPLQGHLIGGPGGQDSVDHIIARPGGGLVLSGKHEQGLTRGVSVPQPAGVHDTAFVIGWQ